MCKRHVLWINAEKIEKERGYILRCKKCGTTSQGRYLGERSEEA